MSTVNSFDKNNHFSELNSPLFGGSPTPLAASARKTLARANLGTFSATEGVMDARFGEQPLFNQTPGTLNATGTLTAALMLGGIVTSTTASAVTATLDTAAIFDAAVIAAYPTVAVGDTLDFTVVNTGANAFTVTTATGWTLVGVMAVAATTSGTFKARRTAANTWTLYRL